MWNLRPPRFSLRSSASFYNPKRPYTYLNPEIQEEVGIEVEKTPNESEACLESWSFTRYFLKRGRSREAMDGILSFLTR